MTPLAQWAVKNYTPQVRNVGFNTCLFQKRAKSTIQRIKTWCITTACGSEDCWDAFLKNLQLVIQPIRSG